MSLVVREMAVEEVELIIDYFHGSTPEHLELLGVDCGDGHDEPLLIFIYEF